MRYLTLAEALVIAEAVTGTDASIVAKAARLDLLDSSLHAPQSGFADEEFFPRFVDKAAVLTVRIARNHPLPDGNKRLAWQALRMFCALNGRELSVTTDEAVATMLAVAAGEIEESQLADWIGTRLRSAESATHPAGSSDDDP